MVGARKTSSCEGGKKDLWANAVDGRNFRFHFFGPVWAFEAGQSLVG